MSQPMSRFGTEKSARGSRSFASDRKLACRCGVRFASHWDDLEGIGTGFTGSSWERRTGEGRISSRQDHKLVAYCVAELKAGPERRRPLFFMPSYQRAPPSRYRARGKEGVVWMSKMGMPPTAMRGEIR